jgi:hypothetical protein
MSFLGVVFVVLMLLALFGGGWSNYDNNVFNFRGFSGLFILWLCVAILGYIVLAGGEHIGHTVIR